MCVFGRGGLMDMERRAATGMGPKTTGRGPFPWEWEEGQLMKDRWECGGGEGGAGRDVLRGELTPYGCWRCRDVRCRGRRRRKLGTGSPGSCTSRSRCRRRQWISSGVRWR